jgi:hypothetical protein
MHSQTALNSVYFKSSNGGEPVESPGASTRKIKAIQKQVEVHIYQHGTQELTDVDELGYEHYTLHNADETSLSLKALGKISANLTLEIPLGDLEGFGPVVIKSSGKNICKFDS